MHLRHLYPSLLCISLSLVTFSARGETSPLRLTPTTGSAAQQITGEATGTLSVSSDGTIARLEGSAAKPGAYAENWTLSAAVLDYTLPNPIALPASANHITFRYRRPVSQNPSGSEVNLRVLIGDQRGGVWAVGTRLGAKRSQLASPESFSAIETYAFDTSEAGRLDPWVMMSLDPERFDTYDAPQPPLTLKGFRVITMNADNTPHLIELQDLAAPAASERQSPYWALVPQRTLTMRQGLLYPSYNGEYGWGKTNAEPFLKGAALKLSSGTYQVGWEILDQYGWRTVASDARTVTLAVPEDTLARLPLLPPGTYQLRLGARRSGDKTAKEFFLSYVVIRNTDDQSSPSAPALPQSKPLRFSSQAGPVFTSDQPARLTLQVAPEALRDRPAAKLVWSIEARDARVLHQEEANAATPLEIDLSRWSGEESAVWVTARLVDKTGDVDIARRIVGFAADPLRKSSSKRIAPLKKHEADKLEKAIAGEFYRMKGDWTEGATPVVSQARDTLQKLDGWLDEARYIGYNLVELSAPWDDLNPLPGVWQFDYLDRQVEAARERGLRVTFRVHPNATQTPFWVKREFMQDEGGFAHGLWSGGDNLFFSPAAEEYRRSLFAYAKALATHYRDDSTVVGYCMESLFFDHDMIDMPWLGQYIDYSEASRDGFHRFLEKRYRGKIARLNKTYQTTYRAWSDVPLPHPKLEHDADGRIKPRTDALWTDWSDFKRDSIASLRLGALDAFRSGDPHCWIGLYNTASVAFYADEVAQRGSWITYGSMESQHPPVAPSIRGRYEPHGKIAKTRTLLDVGMSNILLSGPPGYSGLFNYWHIDKRIATVTPAEREAEERLKQWFSVVDRVVGAIPVGDANAQSGGYLFAPGTQLTLLQHLFSGRTEDYLKPWIFRTGEDKVRAHEVPMLPGSVPSLDHYSWLYAPFGAATIEDPALDEIVAYVKQGGRLVIESTSGFWMDDQPNALGKRFGLPVARPVAEKGATETEAATWLPSSPLADAPSPSFRTREFVPPINQQASPWVHNIPRAFLRPYRMQGSETALPSGSQVIARYADGSPAAVLRRIGKGEVIAFYGVLDWIGRPGLARSLDDWGRCGASASTKHDDPELIIQTLRKDNQLFALGRRFLGHDYLDRLKTGLSDGVPTEPKTLAAIFASASLPIGDYHVHELLSGRDLGQFTAASMTGSGVPLLLAPGEAFILEATPVAKAR